jgi:two-component sensor histidine kinase
VLICVTLGIALFLVSGGIRALALRQAWWDRGGAGLVLRLLLAIVLGASLAQLLITLVLLPALRWEWVALHGGTADYRPAAALGYWLNTAVILAMWVGAWAACHGVRRTRHSELARLRAEAERNALERDALRARLNPHFVFNALNNLRALINEDTVRAREMVTRLSNTLRRALEHVGDAPIRLEHELALVEDYLAVEQVHYEQRLRVRRRIDAAAMQASLPAMALQLLVENAIKHGISMTPEGGELDIGIQCRGDDLHIQVGNPLPPQAAPAGHGVGLAYLRSQLGPGGHVELRSEGGRMQAHLVVPQ